MNRDKVLELAREAELARQFALEVPFVVDRLERFAALIEREVRGDAEPVVNNWSVFNTSGAEIASGLSLMEVMDYLTDERLGRGWNAVCVVDKENMPILKTHPAPAVVRQLVEALSRMTTVFLDADGSYGSHETDAMDFAEAALAAAKEAGL